MVGALGGPLELLDLPPDDLETDLNLPPTPVLGLGFEPPAPTHGLLGGLPHSSPPPPLGLGSILLCGPTSLSQASCMGPFPPPGECHLFPSSAWVT